MVVDHYYVFGLAGTGKDTFGELMEKHLGVTQIALADPVREEYVRFYGKHDYKQNREKMITIAETYKYLYGKDVWCKQAITGIIPFQPLLIKDGRYVHEYDFFVSDRKFIPIRLVCSEETRLARLQKRDGTIQLEALAFEKVNFIPDHFPAINISTDGTVEELADKIKELF